MGVCIGNVSLISKEVSHPLLERPELSTKCLALCLAYLRINLERVWSLLSEGDRNTKFL